MTAAIKTFAFSDLEFRKLKSGVLKGCFMRMLLVSIVLFIFSVSSGVASELLENIPLDESFVNAGKPDVRLPFPLSVHALKAVALDKDSVGLSWRPPFLSKGVTGYKIYRNHVLLASVSASARFYVDKTVVVGTEYFYTVRSVNARERESALVGIFAYDGYQSSQGAKSWERIIKMPFVSGITVSFFWKDVEEKRGEFNWQHIDDLLDLAKKYNKKVGLWPYMPSPWCPDWLKDKIKKYDTDSSHRTKSNIPYVLDPLLTKEWSRFIATMGTRYNGNPQVEYVLVSLNGTSGMHNNVQPDIKQFELLKSKFGYSVDKHIKAWKRTFGLYEKAFPDTPWGYGIQFTNAEVGPALAVADWALARYGSRVRVLNEGLNGNNWYRFQWALNGWKLNNEYIADQNWRTVSGYQMLGNSWTARGDGTGRNGPMDKALENGLDYGSQFLEIWTRDIVRGEYLPLFKQAAASMGMVNITIPTKPVARFRLYVNQAILSNAKAKIGDEIIASVTLTASDKLEKPYNVFVHLVDEKTGKLELATTAKPVKSMDRWEVGYSEKMTASFTVSERMAERNYKVVFGAYCGRQRIRLATLDDVELPGDNTNRYNLGTLSVEAD